jgi:hypothetical protein
MVEKYDFVVQWIAMGTRSWSRLYINQMNVVLVFESLVLFFFGFVESLFSQSQYIRRIINMVAAKMTCSSQS